ncbi:MAG TPA: hypothetical protein PKU80_02915 [Candidatus Limiplasma sp.]|nr:hypothetical protein [Candidatus Limiplasma sp.]HRX07695.1 hypothetical protein [Candidatus Limiplasma sp.]
MNETEKIIQALSDIQGIASVTRGWPRQDAQLPCVALQLLERSAVDTRDNEVYLTKSRYLVRVFGQTLSACDALKAEIAAAMAALAYTLERVQETDHETAQLRMTFEKLE